jgi:choice-of-anchor C domain-containing protein
MIAKSFQQFVIFGLAFLPCLAVPGTCHAGFFINGGFEENSLPSFNTSYGLSSGSNFSTWITGWKVTSGTIGYVNTWSTTWPDESSDPTGTKSIHLNGPSGAGSISQTFDTVEHQAYLVGFYVSGNPDNYSKFPKTMSVSATGNSAIDYTVAGNVKKEQWANQTYTFIASGSSTTLTFSGSMADGAWGAVLDNVSVTPIAVIPEPSALVLLATGGGVLSIVGYCRRSTAKAKPSAISAAINGANTRSLI